MEQAEAAKATAGWYPDAAQPGRERWWDGAHWTARVLLDGDEQIGWVPDVLELPPPARVTIEDGGIVIDLTGSHLTWEEDQAPTEDVVLRPGGAPGVHAPSRFLAPEPQMFLPITRDPARFAAPVTDLPKARRRRRARRIVLVAAAAMLLLGAAAASAAIIDSRSIAGEPISPVKSRPYRDAAAGFTLQYPRAWRIDKPEHGTGVRFSAGPITAAPAESNTIAVIVGTDVTALPKLSDFAGQVSERLRSAHSDMRLARAEGTRLAGLTAFHLRLIDPSSRPRTRIDQYVGRTREGHSLTVTITVRDPRSAPTALVVRAFIASIQPA